MYVRLRDVALSARRPRLLTLSAKESLILELLVREHEMYGLQMVAASKRRLKRGTVYVTLGRMEEKGYLTSRLEDAPPDAGGLPRRLYQPTALGRRVLTAWTTAARTLIPEFTRMTRPGWRLRGMAARIFDHKTMERVVDPLLADLQKEHAEAIRRGRVWKSRWIRLAG